MWKSWKALLMLLLCSSASIGCVAEEDNGSSPNSAACGTWCTLGYVGAGVGAVAAAPVVLGAVGFTGAGIAAGSIAAKMMAASAVANGGGVVAGGTVAVLQSLGATAGASAVGSALGAVGGAAAAAIHNVVSGNKEKSKDEK